MGAPAAARSMHLVLVVAGVVCLLVALTVFVVFGGWEYYRAPLGTRGYLPSHQVCGPRDGRASAGHRGRRGDALHAALCGTQAVDAPQAPRHGARWLEVHIFFGIVGRCWSRCTSFKFNGLISVAHWLMMRIWASGFVGRYLRPHPKSIAARSSRAEVDGQLLDVRTRLSTLPLPRRPARDRGVRGDGHAGEWTRASLLDLFLGELRVACGWRSSGGTCARRAWTSQPYADAIAWPRTARSSCAACAPAAHAPSLRALARLYRPLVYGMFVIVGCMRRWRCIWDMRGGA
jgi:hypothetical protein